MSLFVFDLLLSRSSSHAVGNRFVVQIRLERHAMVPTCSCTSCTDLRIASVLACGDTSCKSFADITKSVNYGFKSPGDFADAHELSETGPVPIGGTKPANGLNG